MKKKLPGKVSPRKNAAAPTPGTVTSQSGEIAPALEFFGQLKDKNDAQIVAACSPKFADAQIDGDTAKLKRSPDFLPDLVLTWAYRFPNG